MTSLGIGDMEGKGGHGVQSPLDIEMVLLCAVMGQIFIWRRATVSPAGHLL